MKLPRRTFLTATALAGAGFSLGAADQIAPPKAHSAKKPVKLGISTYSYWHFRPPKVSIETVIDKTAELGVGGVDILHRQMDLAEKEPLNAAGRAYLRKLKRHAFLNGIDLICLSTHQNFVSPKPDEIDRNVEHTKKCIEIAYQLGAPCIRINTGRWNTVDFDYKQIASILADVSYHGYVSLEFEGKENAQTAVPKSIEMLRRAFA